MALSVRDAVFPRDSGAIHLLLREYEAGLGVSLCFQGYEEELRDLPGRYAPPQGGLLVAEGGSGPPVGCVALRGIAPGVCEMKRLYVRPSARRGGAGRLLAEAIVERARELGHHRIVLDTLGRMGAAIALYRALGFAEVAPYCENPFDDAVFLGLELT